MRHLPLGITDRSVAHLNSGRLRRDVSVLVGRHKNDMPARYHHIITAKEIGEGGGEESEKHRQ